ncbi:MAG: NAD(P)/FAD-dependent oxidoreductase [Roseobacter sp.]
MTQHVIVVGAGIVGVSTGIWLRRAGADVTIVDRLGPGEGTSHGNAGVLAACAMVPVTMPGLIQKAPKYLLDPTFPLFLRWRYLPKLAPWLRKYLSHANDADTRRIALGLTPIVSDSVAQHKSLVQDLGLEHWVSESEYCFAYQSKAKFDADSYVWDLRRAAGFEPQLIEGPDVQDYEPNISSQIQLIASVKDHGFIRDPGGYVRALAQAFQGLGGKIVQADVNDFDMIGDQIAAVETTQGRIACDSMVLCTGAWSKPLMQKLGISVPLESERGYHVVYEDATGGPSRPTMIAAGKFVATPMAQGVRCAGVVELGGLKAGPSKAPFALLRKQAKENFPNLNATNEIEWMGHRPAPSDSLPLIGQIGASRVFTAFGHHHIGLTGGPKTGRLVAGLITDQPTNMDLRAYAPERFKT